MKRKTKNRADIFDITGNIKDFESEPLPEEIKGLPKIKEEHRIILKIPEIHDEDLKKDLFYRARLYYNQDTGLEEENILKSADNWLDGYLFALRELKIITEKEMKTWRKKIKQGERL